MVISSPHEHGQGRAWGWAAGVADTGDPHGVHPCRRRRWSARQHGSAKYRAGSALSRVYTRTLVPREHGSGGPGSVDVAEDADTGHVRAETGASSATPPPVRATAGAVDSSLREISAPRKVVASSGQIAVTANTPTSFNRTAGRRDTEGGASLGRCAGQPRVEALSSRGRGHRGAALRSPRSRAR